MIYIAHRGLFNGPDVNLENRPQQIELALSEGYHCEVDVWYVDDKWFLGHDFPDYKISYEFLEQPNLWLHAKNLDALYVMGADKKLNFFLHLLVIHQSFYISTVHHGNRDLHPFFR